jgi:hypothetical protein
MLSMIRIMVEIPEPAFFNSVMAATIRIISCPAASAVETVGAETLQAC